MIPQFLRRVIAISALLPTLEAIARDDITPATPKVLRITSTYERDPTGTPKIIIRASVNANTERDFASYLWVLKRANGTPSFDASGKLSGYSAAQIYESSISTTTTPSFEWEVRANTWYEVNVAGVDKVGNTSSLTEKNISTVVLAARESPPAAAYRSAPEIINLEASSEILIPGQQLTLALNTTGAGPVNIQWLRNGTQISGATSRSYTIESVTTAESGLYSVVASNSSGIAYASRTIEVSPPRLTVFEKTFGPDRIEVPLGKPVEIGVYGLVNPPGTYTWSRDGVVIIGETRNTLYISSVTNSDQGLYSATVSNALGSVTRDVARITTFIPLSPPKFDQEPSSVSITDGSTVSLTASASGNPPPQYTWVKDGQVVAGATGSTLTINRAGVRDQGRYYAVANNSLGAATSATATVTVTPGTPANITSQPFSVAARLGQAAALSVTILGSPTPEIQWFKSGVAIPGATAPKYEIADARLSDSGTYWATVRNFTNNTSYNLETTRAEVTVLDSRLINLSVLTPIASGEKMTLGTVLGGSGTAGTKALLVRAAGPSLAQLNVSGFMTDPLLTVYRGQNILSTNDNWGGSTVLSNQFAASGAFAYISSNSLDSAYYSQSLTADAYTVEVGGTGANQGIVIAEVYDATPSANTTARTPRLLNLSVLKQIRSGDSLTSGFVIAGNIPKRILIRAVGPTLGAAPFNITGAMEDPQLTVYSGSSILASNDNWGSTTGSVTVSSLIEAFNSVAAFRMQGPSSRDAALVLTLNPGSYSAVISSTDNREGVILTEVYELP